MNVDIFKIFVTVVEQKHFSRAAELLNLSQPGVSMHIRNWKMNWGLHLFSAPKARPSYGSWKHIIHTRKANALTL